MGGDCALDQASECASVGFGQFAMTVFGFCVFDGGLEGSEHAGKRPGQDAFGLASSEWDGEEVSREGMGVVGGKRGEEGVVLEDGAGCFEGGGGEREETSGFFKYVA